MNKNNSPYIAALTGGGFLLEETLTLLPLLQAENGDLFYNFFIYQYPAEKEQSDPSKAQNTQDTLTRNAHSPEFVQYIHQRIIDHITILPQGEISIE